MLENDVKKNRAFLLQVSDARTGRSRRAVNDRLFYLIFPLIQPEKIPQGLVINHYDWLGSKKGVNVTV